MAFEFTSDLLLALLGCFIPPLPVWVKRGLWNADFLINCLLTLLGIPGIIHAWYIVAKYPDDGLPFLMNRAEQSTGYVRIDDEEAQAGAPPPSTAGDTEEPLYNHHSQTGGAGSSSQQPPHYDDVASPGHPVGLDNKVQRDN